MTLIIIGLDGFNEKLLSLEECSFISKLYNEGTSGILKSTIPPITACAWTSFQTGMDVGNHGVYWFEKKHLISSRDIKDPTFHEIMDNRNVKQFLMNLPYTYPPKIKGNLITSWLDPVDIVPETLIKKYNSIAKEHLEFKDIKGLKKKSKINNKHIDILKEVISKDDHEFYFFLISATDWLQHTCFSDLIRNENNTNTQLAKKILKEVDETIEWIVKNMDEDDNLIILSDHGFNNYEKCLYINSWLKERNYLKLNTSRGSHFYTFLYKINDIFPLKKILKKLRNIDKSVKKREKNIQPKIDYDNSLAYCLNSSRKAIKVKKYKDYNILCDSILNDLNNIEDISAWHKNDIFKGKNLDKITDVVFIFSNRYTLSDKILNKTISNGQFNGHHPDGILICYGPSFRKDYKYDKGRIYDIAPTILHMFDIPVPKSMDGRVLTEIFRPESRFAKKQIKYSSYEKESLREKVKFLKDKSKI